MTIYYLFLLKKSPIWSWDDTSEIDKLQAEYLAEGRCSKNKFVDVQELISSDPIVKMGRLVFDLYAWAVDKNIWL